MSSKLAELLETQALQGALTESFKEMHRIALDIENTQEENQHLRAEVEVLRQDLSAQTSSIDLLVFDQVQMIERINKCEGTCSQNQSEIAELSGAVDSEIESFSQEVNFIKSSLRRRLDACERSFLREIRISGLRAWVRMDDPGTCLKFDAKENVIDASVMLALSGLDEFYLVEILSLFKSSNLREDAFDVMIENLKKESVLKKLILSESSITTNALLNLLECDPFPHLTTLYVSDCPNVDVITFLDALVESPLGQRIEHLRVKGYGLKKRQRNEYMSRLPCIHDKDLFVIAANSDSF